MSDYLREAVRSTLGAQAIVAGNEETNLLTPDEYKVLSSLRESGFFTQARDIGDLNRHILREAIIDTIPLPISKIEKIAVRIESVAKSGRLMEAIDQYAPTSSLTESMGSPELHKGQDNEGMYGTGDGPKAPKGKADKGQKQKSGSTDTSGLDRSGYTVEAEEQLEAENEYLRGKLRSMVSESDYDHDVIIELTSDERADALCAEFEMGTFDFFEGKKGKVKDSDAHEPLDDDNVEEASETPEADDAPEYGHPERVKSDGETYNRGPAKIESKDVRPSDPGAGSHSGYKPKASDPGPGQQHGVKPKQSEPGPGNDGKAKSKADSGTVGSTGLSQNEQAVHATLTAAGIEEGSQAWYRAWYSGMDAISEGRM